MHENIFDTILRSFYNSSFRKSVCVHNYVHIILNYYNLLPARRDHSSGELYMNGHTLHVRGMCKTACKHE
jgi:hypothetical protein